jgi:tetratricopeptide (TPR) repeat protein
MATLGNGLSAAEHHEDALAVQEAELSMYRRIGAPEHKILGAQNNLANTYEKLGRVEEAICMRQDVYSGRLELSGKEHEGTLRAANNYASTLVTLERFEEAKSVLRKTMPVARRVLGEGNNLTLKMRKIYAKALFRDAGAALDDLREAVATLEDAGRTARRVLGAAHPLTVDIEEDLEGSRAALRAREGDVESLREAVEAMTPGDA